MKLVGYARVSTLDQDLALQHDALRAAGGESIHDDHGLSGKVANRPGFAAALADCVAGDVLVAWKLDRLGRSDVELLQLVQDLDRRGVGLKVLTGAGASIDTTRPEGKLIFAVFAAMAEFERDLTPDRRAHGGGHACSEAPGPACRPPAQADAARPRRGPPADRQRAAAVGGGGLAQGREVHAAPGAERRGVR